MRDQVTRRRRPVAALHFSRMAHRLLLLHLSKLLLDPRLLFELELTFSHLCLGSVSR